MGGWVGNGLLKNTSLIIRRISACAVKREESGRKKKRQKKRKNCHLRFSTDHSSFVIPFVCVFPALAVRYVRKIIVNVIDLIF